ENVWALEAPEELVEQPASLDMHTRNEIDARVIVFSAENVFASSELPAERRLALRRASHTAIDMAADMEKPWGSCPFPTHGPAQAAGVSLRPYAAILVAACLRDWDAEGERMKRYAEPFDAAEQVRIVGPETDLTLSVAGRHADIDDAHRNMPGGELFLCPLEDS